MGLKFAIKKVIIIIKNNFEATNLNARWVKKTNKYLILFIVMLWIDSY